MQMHGQALSSIGIGLAAAGAAGAAFFKTAVDSAIEYTRQAAYTKTQTDKVVVSIDQLKEIGREVGSVVPTEFDHIQQSLYDIFSSIDVNLPQAKALLHTFARESVAGQESLAEAGRGTIAVLNAFHLPVTDATKVADVMFQLVRKGVGTYTMFNRTIGRAIPSTVRAGQSFEDLAGMMAFLTRNGLSTAMASASAARALDAFSNPKVVQRLEEMGIKVRDIHGEFRPISGVVAELGKKLKDMTGPERAEALQELFKGAGGTIQARRFYDIAIKNYAELIKYTGQMKHSKGAMKEAYDIMFKQPQSQAMLLSNNFKILKTIVGDALLPTWLKLTGAVIKAMQWFQKLSPHTREMIVKFAALAATLAILVGGVLTVAGVILMFVAAMTLAGVSLATVGVVVLIVVAALALIGAGIYLIIKYHKQIWAFMKKVWGDAVRIFGIVSAKVMEVLGHIRDFGAAVGRVFADIGKAIWGEVGKPFMEIVGWIVEIGGYFKNLGKEVWTALGPPFRQIWDAIVKGAKEMWAEIKPALTDFIDGMRMVWVAIKKWATEVKQELSTFVNWSGGKLHYLGDLMEWIGRRLMDELRDMRKAVKVAGQVFRVFVLILVTAFKVLASIIAAVLPPLLQTIGRVIGNIIGILKGLIQVIVGVFTGDWALAWEGIKAIVYNFFNALWNIVKGGFWIIIRGIEGYVKGVVHAFVWLYKKLVGGSIVPEMVKAILRWFVYLVTWAPKHVVAMAVAIGKKAADVSRAVVDIVKKIKAPFDKAKDWLVQKGKDVLTGAMSGMSAKWSDVGRWLGDRKKSTLAWIGDALSWLKQKGRDAFNGFVSGMSEKWTAVATWIGGRKASALSWIGNSLAWLKQKGLDVLQGFWDGLTEKWKAVTTWVGTIGTWIKDHKGPVSLDRQLLKPAGLALMEGFLNGLKSGAGAAWDFVKSIGGKTKEAVAATYGWIKNVGWPAVSGVISGAGANIGQNAALGKIMAAAYGWVGAQWDALYTLWQHESNWSNTVQNPISTAYGIAQFLNSTWGLVGAAKTSDPAGQIAAGLKYILKTYGDPIRAWDFWQGHHWYASGAWNIPYDQIAGLHRGEMVVPSGPAEAIRSGTANAGRTITQNIQIYTQEIDPRKHAADLGWELARRVD